ALDALLRIGPGAGAVVAPGEQYLGADGQLVTATVPLQAVLQYHLNADPGYPLPANVVATPCVMVCTDPNWVIVHASTDQLIGANVRVFWQYRSADGQQVVLDHAPGDRAQQAQTLVFLRVHWTSDHWLVQAGDGGDVPFSSALQTQPVCLVAGQSLGDLLSHYPASGQSWNELPSPQPAAGCVIFTRQLAGTPAVTGSGLLLLYRFGVLLAANDATHRLYHELPVATPAEQALAQQFATG
ncbi:MAG TPA: hypothetical protein VGR57_18610, partial [Ktedonobacterales bacterium]|nr:hypothetical protein [Ktedonobacterales bacterium]